ASSTRPEPKLQTRNGRPRSPVLVLVVASGKAHRGRPQTVLAATPQLRAAVGRCVGRTARAFSSMACWMPRLRRSSARRVKYQARKVKIDTDSRIRLAMALISGLTPKRTAENTSIGKVVAPGPETKLASTKSSSDRAKDIMAPAASDGAIIGMVIRKNTFHGLAPRSMAAS